MDIGRKPENLNIAIKQYLQPFAQVAPYLLNLR